MTSIKRNTTDPPPRKTMLYCFECDHESLIDGDWIIHNRHNAVDYDCPVCGTTITTRSYGNGALFDESGRTACCPSD